MKKTRKKPGGKKFVYHDTDISYKKVLINKRSFISFIQKFLNIPWVHCIDEKHLEVVNTSFITSDFKEIGADVIYKLKLDDMEVIFYCLIEIQSCVDHRMPLRILDYMNQMWRIYLSKKNSNNKNFKIPNIIPIVLYNGSRKWNGPRNFHEIIAGNFATGHKGVDFGYILIDINDYSPDALKSMSSVIAAIFLLEKECTDIRELSGRVAQAYNIAKNISKEELTLFIDLFKWNFIPKYADLMQVNRQTLWDLYKNDKEDAVVENFARNLDVMKEKLIHEGGYKRQKRGRKRG